VIGMVDKMAKMIKNSKKRSVKQTKNCGCCNCGKGKNNSKKTTEEEMMGVIGFGAKAAIGVGVLGALGGMFNNK
jgi:hypothetical protein